VDVFVLVASNTDNSDPGGPRAADLSGVKVSNADTLRIEAIAAEVQLRSVAVKNGTNDPLGPIKGAMRAFPGWISRLGLSAVTLLQYGFNINLSNLGVPRDTFGGALISSMGMFGIRYGFVPLVPPMRLSCLIGIGRAEERPVVVDGNIVIRKILPLTATLDHRVVDGYQAGQLASTLVRLIGDPEGSGL